MNINKCKNILTDSVINDIKRAIIGEIGETWVHDFHPDIATLYIKWVEKRNYPVAEEDRSAAIHILKKALVEFLSKVMPERIPPHVLFHMFKLEFRQKNVLPGLVDDLLYRLLKGCYADESYDIYEIAEKVARDWSNAVADLEECEKLDKILYHLSKSYIK